MWNTSELINSIAHARKDTAHQKTGKKTHKSPQTQFTFFPKSNHLSWKKKKGHFMTRQSLEQSNITGKTQIYEDYFQVVQGIL